MYDPLISYEENLSRGPSADWNRGGFFPKLNFSAPPRFSILGLPMHLPLGMPAGPLLSAAFVKVALEAGFCMPVYKTVRSSAWPSHPWPNVLSVETLTTVPSQTRPQATVVPLQKTILLDEAKRKQLSITNAFGVPSQSPDQWSADFQSLPDSAFASGAMTVLSFQGSRRTGASWNQFLDDTELCARLAAQTVLQRGGRILEMNVSCPNEAGAPIYSDRVALAQTLRAASAALREFPTLKLIVKLGILPTTETLHVVELVAQYAHGISAINTLSANISTPDGKRALGSQAEHGGICGEVIRAHGITAMRSLHRARSALSLHSDTFALIGVGGCSTAAHVEEYLSAGADMVHAATGAMWNLQLAQECARKLSVPTVVKE